MVNIRLLKIKIALILLLVSYSTFACAQTTISYHHLGNSGKKFTSAGDMSSKDWNHPNELERVWQASFVRIPEENEQYIQTVISLIDSVSIPDNKKYPTVIYLHGCSGYWAGTIRRINFLAKNGFAVIAPPSFAREKYPRSCDVSRQVGGLYRDTIRMRKYDAGYAIEQAKSLPWVDNNNVFLMGLSEGGITAATFFSKESNRSVNARVVEGWTCTSVWDEYKGVRAPKNEPVLTLLGSKDPWFQSSYTNGECASFLNKHNGSKSVVFREGDLSHKHELLEDKEVQSIVLEFLYEHLRLF